MEGHVLACGVKDAFGLPYPEKGDEDGHADDGGGDIDQPGPVEYGDEKLGDAESCAGDEDRGPDFKHGAEAGEGPDEPERDEDAERSEDTADNASE